MKVLVTGGAGFIGSHLVDELVARGDEVVVIDDMSTGKKGNLNHTVKLINLDISNPKTVETVKKEKPQKIFHLAAQILVTVSVKNPRRDAEVNTRGLLNVLEGAVKAGTKKFVYSSTAAVYGNPVVIPTNEEVYPKPLSPYGITKLAGEHYLNFYRNVYGLDSTSLRYSNVYGPRQNPFGEGGAVAIFTQKLVSGERPTIFGDGSMTRDYVFVGDVVRANLLASDSTYPGPFNIGTGVGTSTLSLFQKIKALSKSSLEPEHEAERPGEVKRSIFDISKSKKLKWKPIVGIDIGLKKTLSWYKNIDR